MEFIYLAIIIPVILGYLIYNAIIIKEKQETQRKVLIPIVIEEYMLGIREKNPVIMHGAITNMHALCSECDKEKCSRPYSCANCRGNNGFAKITWTTYGRVITPGDVTTELFDSVLQARRDFKETLGGKEDGTSSN